MSVWTEVTGTVTFHKYCGLSLKTLIEEMFMESCPSVRQTDVHVIGKITADVNFNFSDSNLSAAKTMQELVDKIKEYDKHAWIDLEATIRFVG